MASQIDGLIQVRKRRVSLIRTDQGPYRTPVHTALQDREGDWWISNRNGFVDRIHEGTLTPLRLVTRNEARPVSCIFEDSKGRRWFCLRDASVMEWDTRVGDFEGRFGTTPGLSKIRAMAEDPMGRLWFAGQHGIFRWDGTTVEDFSSDPLLRDASFTALALAADGTLLAGTMYGRILAFNGIEFQLLGDFGDHPRSWISTILPLADGELWLSTIGAGLFVRQEGQWHRFGTAQGLPDERLTGLTLEGDTLWMGSLGGILATSRGELLRSLGPGEAPGHWMQLGRSDGLATRECVGGVQPGVIRDRDGMLWFPTVEGLAGVDPARLPQHVAPPILHLTSVEVDGVPRLPGDAPIQAGPGRSHLAFHFSGISLSAPEKVSYQVRLDGLDSQPQFIGTERRASYQAVPPGHYRFEVTAMGGDGSVTPQPAVVPIEIRPHLWQTDWFLALALLAVLLLALGIGWLVARRRMRRELRAIQLREALEAERSRISRDLHDDLGASLTELSILSALSAEQNADRELGRSLDRLHFKSTQVVRTLDEIVWATNPTKDSLRSLVEYLAFFAREFLEAVHVPLRTHVARDVPDLEIGPRRRHHLFLATREALNNAVKHAEPTRIDLRIAIENRQLVIRVRDHGRGFVLDYGSSGNGLTNLKKRMTDCGGDCLVDSIQGEGTTVTLTLPLPT